MSDRFPWFPFYAADWRLSNTVRAMTYEQRGLYVELLAIAWDDGIEAPSLPDDATRLAMLTGLGKRWAKIGQPVLTLCWSLDGGRWTNERLTKVWEIQRAKYALRSEVGRLGGIAKAKAKQNAGNASRLLGSSQPVASRFARQTQTSDRTNSSSGAMRVGALTDGALASLTPAGRK